LYFAGEPPKGLEAANFARIGIEGRPRYRWHRFFERFDVAKEPNEPNRFGWVVELDPFEPSSTPAKRTALGRYKHEAATCVVNNDGRVVVYSGDDARFEYIYRFVSDGTVNPADRTANMGLLDSGTLSVAKFDADGSVAWLPLVHGHGPLGPESGFNSQADVLIETRRAADRLGATKMDRPGDIETKPHDGTIITDKVNEMWGTDMTQTITIGEGRAYVFVAVEHANSEVVGIHASRTANRFEALEPVRQGVHRCFGAIAPGVARGLKLRHDHGSNYMSSDFQDEIACLGIEASPSFVREPEGNGVAERFIRTLKENLLWLRAFDTIEELRAALGEFATRYNQTWLVARHGYRTPAQVRADQSRLDQNATADLKLAA